MSDRYAALKLENQLCFPLYACAKEITRQYKPFLGNIDLTYTQYIAMMVLWENQSIGMKELGETLFLDSGTLTPVLKKLEAKGFITRRRLAGDEREVQVTLTEEGKALQEKALDVPEEMRTCVKLDPEEVKTLYHLLYKLLEGMENAGR